MDNVYSISTKTTRFLSDLVTPLSAYLRLREHFPESILLESADRQGGKRELSFVCCDPIAELRIDADGSVKTSVSAQKEDQRSQTLLDFAPEKRNAMQSALEQFLARFKMAQGTDAGLMNGLFGFISYDSVELMEDIKLSKPSVPEEQIPLAFYRLFRYVLAFDHQNSELTFLQNELASELKDDHAKKILAIIQSAGYQLKPFSATGELSSSLSDDAHAELIESCKQHIKRGDVFQIVPSRKFFQSFKGDDLNVYRALRVINPSPYLFYYKTKEFTLIGSSPEAQIQASGKQISINPIAGTYRRTGNDQEDEQAALKLSQDPKEVSEHVMLVDLARNDLSLQCFPVEVARFKEIEFYSHVIHLVSKVQGTLLPGKTSLGAFCSTAPAGTLSGAPKYKAMELLDRYEPSRRHFYGGAIGVLSFNGDIIHGIMIRTFLSKNGTLITQAGSGVVAESDTQKEVQEVKNKLAALWAAVERASTL